MVSLVLPTGTGPTVWLRADTNAGSLHFNIGIWNLEQLAVPNIYDSNEDGILTYELLPSENLALMDYLQPFNPSYYVDTSSEPFKLSIKANYSLNPSAIIVRRQDNITESKRFSLDDNIGDTVIEWVNNYIHCKGGTLNACGRGNLPAEGEQYGPVFIEKVILKPRAGFTRDSEINEFEWWRNTVTFAGSKYVVYITVKDICEGNTG